MEIRDCDGNSITLPALVQSPRTKRVYHVWRIKSNGRLVLWAFGQPKIRSADPRNWRLVKCMEVQREPA